MKRLPTSQMGNCHSPQQSEEADVGLDQLFLRKTKIVALSNSVPGVSINVFDTLGGKKTLKVEPERKSSAHLTVLDSDTLLNFNNSSNALDLIDSSTGKVRFTRTLEPWNIYSHLVVVGNYIFLEGNERLILVKRDLSRLKTLRHLPGVISMDGTRVDGRLASLYLIVEGQGRTEMRTGVVKIRDPKEMKVLKEFEISLTGGEHYSYLRKVDSRHLILVSNFGRITLLNVNTEKVTHFMHFHKKSVPFYVSVCKYIRYSGSGGVRKVWIFLGFPQKVEGITFRYSPEGKVLGDLVRRKFVTKTKNLQGIAAMDENRVLCLDEKGKFEVWEVGGRKNQCLYRGEVGDDAQRPMIAPLTEAEELKETSRLWNQLESYSLPIPKELTRVVAEFI